MSYSDHFINFDVQECYTNKLFCNKIWQATRFTNSAMDKMAPDSLKPTKFDELAVMDRWILSRLSHLVQVSKESLQMYDFHVTTASIKDFLYFNFCDVYLVSARRKNIFGKLSVCYEWIFLVLRRQPRGLLNYPTQTTLQDIVGR